MLKSKWFTWLLAIITLISLPLSYYWYVQATKEVDPTFILEESQQQIIDKSLLEHAPLKISKSNGEQVGGNVYIQKFYFFNQGKEALKPEHILKPVFISLDDPNAEVLDFKMYKITDSVTECLLFRDSVNGNRLNISFRILQEDDGFSGQIIYSADSISKLGIHGKIEGAKTGFSDYYKNKIGLPKFLVWTLAFITILSPLILTALISIWLLRWIDRRRKIKWKRDSAETDHPYEGKSDEEIEAYRKEIEDLQSKSPKNSIHDWLTNDYILTISNADNWRQKTSVVFRYQQVILFSIGFFSIMFIISLFLSTTYLKLWFDPRHKDDRQEIVDPIVPNGLR